MFPKEFLDKVGNRDIKWFLVENNKENDTLIATRETRVLRDSNQTRTIYMVGVKIDNYTMEYREVLQIVYINTTGESHKFDVILKGLEHRRFVLLGINGIEQNLSTEVNVNKFEKMVHLFAGENGRDGERGPIGLSSFDMWSKKYPGVSEDDFIENLNRCYSMGSRLKVLEDQLADIMKTTGIGGAKIPKADVLPISTIIYSHVNPDPARWLPFGVSSAVYYDADYPELAKIVRSWGAAFIVDDERFRLGDASDKNRYLFCAGGDRPAGFVMSSQLPNIKGQIGVAPGRTNISYGGMFYNGSGAFQQQNVSTPGDFDRYLGRRDEPGHRYAIFNAHNSNTIYKDGDIKPFGESLAMNAFIKSKLF